jgi:phage portal protein BeeE
VGREPNLWDTDSLRLPFLTASTPTRETIENDYEGYVGGAYKANGVIFGAIDRRQQVFSQGRLQWRRWSNGVPGDFFGSADLGLLERPWPNGTTGELLSLMEYDASLAGNFYATTVDDRGRFGASATGPGRRITRLRPDWVTLVLSAPSGNPYGADVRVVAYSYQPALTDGNSRNDPLLLLPSEVVHYSPKPDPVARFRGMSWLTPVIQEIAADKAGTGFRLAFLENGAVPGMVVTGIRAANKDMFDETVDMLEERHTGSSNAYKTLYLTDGADARVVGANLRDIDFKAIQGGGETRIAVAGGVPAAILGISEGLAGSSLNEGNFKAARRLFVDSTIQDLWGKAAPALQSLMPPQPPGVELAVDGRWIPFLRENETDRAAIQSVEATTLRTLIDAGFDPASIVTALMNHDWKLLQHSGLFSVQLQEAGQEPAAPTSSANGSPAALNGSRR